MDGRKVDMILQLLLTILLFYYKPRNNVCQGLGKKDRKSGKRKASVA
jgi:hypothetical protein